MIVIITDRAIDYFMDKLFDLMYKMSKKIAEKKKAFNKLPDHKVMLSKSLFFQTPKIHFTVQTFNL